MLLVGGRVQSTGQCKGTRVLPLAVLLGRGVGAGTVRARYCLCSKHFCSAPVPAPTLGRAEHCCALVTAMAWLRRAA